MAATFDHQVTTAVGVPVETVERIQQRQRTGGAAQHPVGGRATELVARDDREERLEVAQPTLTVGVQFRELSGARRVANVIVDQDLEGGAGRVGISALRQMSEGGESEEVTIAIVYASRLP